MKKFLICGDLHYKGMNPRSRLDNFQETVNRKLTEVMNLARHHLVEAIIIPGDLFDSPSTTLGTVGDLAQIFQHPPCPILTIPGNHDLWGANPATKYRTPYGLLAKLGLVWDLTEEPYEVWDEGQEGAEVTVTGIGFSFETDTEAGAWQFTPPPYERARDGRGTSIHVVHSMLLAKPPEFEGMRHTLISQVETTADIVVCGHEHTGFGVVRRDDGTIFINPGALVRLTAHKAEMERQVGVVLLNVDDVDNMGKTEFIPLESALPGHEVLSREHIEQAQARNGKMDEFLALLASEGESKFLEVRDIVEDIAARENIPEAVKRETLERVGRARERLAKSEVAG